MVIGKLVFISGFFDLNENELPFIDAKEIDLLDDSANNSLQNQSSVNYQSPFSRTHKFRSNNMAVKNVKTPNTKEVKIIGNDDQMENVVIKKEDESAVASTSKVNDQLNSQKTKRNYKRKNELADLSLQRLKKTAKNTNVKTRSQKQEEDGEKNA